MTRLLSLVFASVFLLLLSSPTYAITGGELLKQTPEQESAFMVGAISMFDYYNPQRSACANDWYFDNGGDIYTRNVFEKYPDRPAVAILTVLINRYCPATDKAQTDRPSE